MRQVLQALCDLLDEQKGVLVSLLGLSYEERGVISSGEAELLEGIVRKQLRELSKLNAIEKKRMALHKDISTEFGIPESGITVSAIAERAGPDEREEIQKLQAEMMELIDRHAALNAENRELIEAHLEYSETMLNIMVDSEDPLNNFYGGDGRAAAERKKTTVFFDNHA